MKSLVQSINEAKNSFSKQDIAKIAKDISKKYKVVAKEYDVNTILVWRNKKAFDAESQILMSIDFTDFNGMPEIAIAIPEDSSDESEMGVEWEGPDEKGMHAALASML